MRFHIGRLGRGEFIAALLFSYAILFILIIANVPAWLGGIFACANIVWMAILYVGRLHDVGSSGWWMPLVMLTAALGLIVLAAWPGKKEPNKFGDVPPHSRIPSLAG
jgi:uncharacterized membrane protein YhaH (DUF805 family)